MTTYDRDLASVQEVRDLVRDAAAAQKNYAQYDQHQIDYVVKGLVEVAYMYSEQLAKLACEETGFGIWQDKMQKNHLASEMLWQYMKDMKTVGILHEDQERKVIQIGTPMGVIAGIIPSTNPTSTVIYKALIALKSGNAIVFSPHPSAVKCIVETVRVLKEGCVRQGVSPDLIGCISLPTMEASEALMKHRDVAMILATGGSAMVKAAYSSGTPALGVGPGNVPVYIEQSADIVDAVDKIFRSKGFDNGTVCASEQAIVTDRCIESKVRQAVVQRGGYFLKGNDLERVKAIMEKSNGAMNPEIVGKSAQFIADLAGITIPVGTKLLVGEEPGIGKQFPFSKEKLTQLIGFYVVEDSVEACETCHKLLKNGGLGHTLSIHSKNQAVIMEFAMKKPVSRFLVNTPSTHGAVGISTGLAPSLTLGCGTIGGSATSDNVTPLHLINSRWLAYDREPLQPQAATHDAVDIDAICQLIIEELSKIKK
jgi:acetaldehyde dehydrogenase (acetylating)